MPEPVVFVVDDEAQSRKSVCALVNSMGIMTRSFESAEEFLSRFNPAEHGCLVTDVRMMGMSGLDLQQRLDEMEISLPVILLSAYPRIPLVVRAMKAGAVTFLEKPYAEDELWDAIRQALALDFAAREKNEQNQEIRTRFEELSSREREVMKRVVSGKANKVIARELGISIRTVENRRKRVFEIMSADSVATLVRMVIEANLDSA